MKTATSDRGAFLYAAGLQQLSPALEGGRPRLAGHGDTAGRCGWEAFFAAVDRARLTLVFDPEDPSATALVPAEEGRALEPHRSLAEGLERARRFARALRGTPPAGSS